MVVGTWCLLNEYMNECHKYLMIFTSSILPLIIFVLLLHFCFFAIHVTISSEMSYPQSDVFAIYFDSCIDVANVNRNIPYSRIILK